MVKDTRYQVETAFRKELFIRAELKGSNTQLATMLGYKGKWKGKRFTELRNGVIETMTLFQLKKLAKITNISLTEILKHVSPKTPKDLSLSHDK